ncbi:MAG: AAA family ATPase [Gammaproteobacteria bacterium]|nr:AAA family ATPase [Gammaproteobacteria bacterium]
MSAVPTTLIQTKLTAPSSSETLLQRDQLCALLGAERPRAVSLVVAPAGFGKTTLVCQWLDSLSLPTAWFSVDEWDNDPVRFWSYLLSAIQQCEPEFARTALTALASSQPPKMEALLPALINQLAQRGEPLVLVLDDYHLIDNANIQRTMQRFIEHLPSHIYLLITSRTEVALPLSRLRVSQQLTEIHEHQLRFSAIETASFYANSMALSLDERTCETLHRRTEGWVAALQLAGLSLQRVTDRAGFLAEFAGDDRLIADYLTEEVLSQQRPELRRFLLLTAHLPRFNADLCDAVLGGGDSRELLVELEQRHMFLIPLDQRRRWYRYHHLFASLLVQQSADEAERRTVHRRASEWYAEQESMEEALLHAFQAEDFVWAGALLDRFGMRLFHGGSVRALRAWMQQLPTEVLEASAQRLIIYVWALFASTDENVEPWLQKIEILIESDPETRLCTEPQLNLMRSFSAMHQGDVHRALALVESSQAQLPVDESHTHTAPGLLLCVAYFVTGQLQKCAGSVGEKHCSEPTPTERHFVDSSAGGAGEVAAAFGACATGGAAVAEQLALAARAWLGSDCRLRVVVAGG